LANYIHHGNIEYLKLIFSLFLLGPIGVYQYIKVSRIMERALARIKAQLL